MINSGGKFISLGEKIRLPDDVTIGYIIEYILGKNLTVVPQFHSHLEPMKFLTTNIVKDHVSLLKNNHLKLASLVKMSVNLTSSSLIILIILFI